MEEKKDSARLWDIEHVASLFGQGHNSEFKKWLEMTEKAERHYRAEFSALLEEHPREWVAIGADGVIAFGNTQGEAWDKAESLGFDKTDMVVRSLDPGPIVFPSIIRTLPPGSGARIEEQPDLTKQAKRSKLEDIEYVTKMFGSDGPLKK